MQYSHMRVVSVLFFESDSRGRDCRFYDDSSKPPATIKWD